MRALPTGTFGRLGTQHIRRYGYFVEVRLARLTSLPVGPLVAVQANVAYGLPLTLADRTAAPARIVRAHAEWSDRMIAGFVGLAPKTVVRYVSVHLRKFLR